MAQWVSVRLEGKGSRVRGSLPPSKIYCNQSDLTIGYLLELNQIVSGTLLYWIEIGSKQNVSYWI